MDKVINVDEYDRLFLEYLENNQLKNPATSFFSAMAWYKKEREKFNEQLKEQNITVVREVVNKNQGVGISAIK